MNAPILCFGEILWDLLPDGKVLGGAPFNVAYRLHESGQNTLFCSAIGDDQFGREIRLALEKTGLAHHLKISSSLSTGVVNVKLDSNGSASYTIEDPAAWDDIDAPDDWSGELVFGSLALRHEANERTLLKLVKSASQVYFDVNLRAPYFTFQKIADWIDLCNLVKFNEEEFEWFSLQQSWHPTEALGQFFNTYPKTKLCITKGEKGALLALDSKQIFESPAPKIELVDTIGAGDAFFATLIGGMRQGKDSQLILNMACEVGAKVASQKGATIPL